MLRQNQNNLSLKQARKPRMASRVQAKHSAGRATLRRQQPQQLKPPPANAFKAFWWWVLHPTGLSLRLCAAVPRGTDHAFLFALHQLAGLCDGTSPARVRASEKRRGKLWVPARPVGTAAAGHHGASPSDAMSGSARVWCEAEAVAGRILVLRRCFSSPATQRDRLRGSAHPHQAARAQLKEPRFGSGW